MKNPTEYLAYVNDRALTEAAADYDVARQKLLNNEGDLDVMWGALTAADALRRAVAR